MIAKQCRLYLQGFVIVCYNVTAMQKANRILCAFFGVAVCFMDGDQLRTTIS